jgi:hypothetical protein
VVSRVEKTLGEVTPASGGGKVTFEQAVNGELNPTIKLGDKLITWSPATKKIAKDGEWTYDIKPGAGPFDNAAIGRENTRNQSEFWHRDNARGEEIVQGIDGSKKVTTWFVSGKLAGKRRSIVEAKSDGTSITLLKLSYDEEGRVNREWRTGREMRFLNSSFGSGKEIYRNGQLVLRSVTSREGNEVTVVDSAGKSTIDKYTYNESNHSLRP